MKRIGKHITRCSFIMNQELNQLLPALLICLILLSITHVIALLRIEQLLPYAILYYFELFLWRGDMVIGFAFIAYLLFSQIYRKKGNQRLLRYATLPVSNTVVLIGRIAAIATLLLLFCMIIALWYCLGYAILSHLHVEIADAGGVFAVVKNANYLTLFLPLDVSHWCLTLLLILTLSIILVTLQTAFLHPVYYAGYFIALAILIVCFSLWNFFYDMPISLALYLEQNRPLYHVYAQFIQMIQGQAGGIWMLAGFDLLAVLSIYISQHRQRKRKVRLS